MTIALFFDAYGTLLDTHYVTDGLEKDMAAVRLHIF